MPKPVCVKCKLFFRPKQNGFIWTEGMPVSQDLKGEWQPYKVWRSDLWECQKCGDQIIVGHGSEPIAEHWQLHFESANTLSNVQVNDC